MSLANRCGDDIRARLWMSVSLVSQCMVFSTVVGSSMHVFSELWYDFMLKNGFHNEIRLALYEADTYSNMPVILPNGTTPEGRFKESVANLLFNTIPICGLWPVLFFFYLTRQNFPMKGALLSFGFTTLSFFIGYTYFGIFFFARSVAFFSFVGFVVVLKCSLPADSSIPRLMGYQVVIAVIGQLWLEAQRWLPFDTEWFQAILFVMIYPVLRETARFFATKCTWYLSTQDDVFSTSKNVLCLEEENVARKHSWTFVAWVQLSLAIYYRLQVANINDPLLAVAIVLWQAALEVVMRMTMKTRDNFLNRKMHTYKKRRRKRKTTKIHSLYHSVFNRGSSKTRGAQRQDAKSAFYSMVILTDMMSEYTAIAVSTFYIAYLSDHVLDSPFAYFTMSQQVNESVNLSPLFQSAALQFVGEIVVDVFCVYFERHVESMLAWKAMLSSPIAFAVLYLFTSLAAGKLAILIIFSSGSLSACLGRDLCYCVDNGLVPGGVQEAYCKLIYPNTSGILPYNTTGTD